MSFKSPMSLKKDRADFKRTALNQSGKYIASSAKKRIPISLPYLAGGVVLLFIIIGLIIYSSEQASQRRFKQAKKVFDSIVQYEKTHPFDFKVLLRKIESSRELVKETYYEAGLQTKKQEIQKKSAILNKAEGIKQDFDKIPANYDSAIEKYTSLIKNDICEQDGFEGLGIELNRRMKEIEDKRDNEITKELESFPEQVAFKISKNEFKEARDFCDKFPAYLKNAPKARYKLDEFRSKINHAQEIYDQKRLRISELYPWKGVLNLPGADSENLPWEKAREKKTEHFIIRTNLSAEALNDICFLLEYAYLIWHDFLEFPEPKEKLKVFIAKNRAEFEKLCSNIVCPPEYVVGAFFAKEGNKFREDWLVALYEPRRYQYLLSETLVHEGTHYALKLVERDCGREFPIWLSEGLATYFECCNVVDRKLVNNFITPVFLSIIKDAINNNRIIKLSDFINLSPSKYSTNKACYSEGRSLVYFLINGQGGKYKEGFRLYIEAWKKGMVIPANKTTPDKQTHIKVFEECIGVPIDQLEKEWKEYILELK